MAEPEYDERYCAFIDILGFGELSVSFNTEARRCMPCVTYFQRFIILRRPTLALSLDPTFAL